MTVFKVYGMLSKFYLKRFLIYTLIDTVLEVFLGIPCQRNTALHLLNLIMLFTKQFIYLSKKNDNPLLEYIFRKVLYGSIETEFYLCKLKGKNHEFIRLIENMLEFVENRYFVIRGTSNLLYVAHSFVFYGIIMLSFCISWNCI